MSPASRIVHRLEALAQCTDDPPRLTRTFLSPALRRAHEVVRGWMEEAGLEVRVDAIGNLIGEQPKASPHQPVLLLGSHLDSVRDAGKFDGPLGVLLGIECAAAFHRRELPFRLEVVGFSDEEGVRFQSTYLGSRAIAGTFDTANLALRDANGISLEEALNSWGSDAAALGTAAHRREDVLAYLEAHIEQGPVLQERNLPVGVVTAIAGQHRARVQFRGTAGHAGTVPMELRHDALCAASEFILTVERLGHQTAGLVATVGQAAVQPGASNVIPGVVDLTLDVRHQDDEILRGAAETLRSAANLIAKRRGLECDFTVLQESRATPCDRQLRQKLGSAIEKHGYERCELASGAGHDAVALAALCPVGMLFVRCRDGLSHHPDEYASEADIGVALDVMITAIESLALAHG